MSNDIVITLVVIVLLLLLSSFFSGSETSLTTTSRARMHELERRGNKRAAIVQQLTAMRERLIGTVLLGNNLVNIAASALATSVLLRLFGEAGIIYATIVMTVLVLLFAEVLPKTYAIINADKVALVVAPIINVFVTVFGPVVMAIEYLVKHTLRLFGADISKAVHVLSAHDELRGAIALHRREGGVVKKDHDMLGGILDLQDLTVSDVMVHRTNMVMIDGSESPDTIIQEVLKSGHTRIPVWKDTPENILGVLHAKDLLKELQKHKGDVSKINLEEIIFAPWFVPDTRPVADQLNAFLRRKTHFALVVDEYGEVMGLVTLEDIIEEIVGDIADEHDVVVPGVRPEPGGSYIVEGIVPVRDLNRLNDWDLPDGEVTTVAGLVIHEARMIPEIGQAFTFHGFRFEVLRKRRHQITSLRITPLKTRKAKGHLPARASAP
ncbi:MAG TPA: HlyC/CorC family transporter [Aestuariivirgaceae bacterium]|jgi:Mg2+/Co2+ transporter CorB